MVALQKFVLINARIPSASMENNVMTGDRIFGNRLAYINSEPKRFDVVIFKFPDNESKYFIKRVIGLPGETVDVIDGKVYINGSKVPWLRKSQTCVSRSLSHYGLPYISPILYQRIESLQGFS